jgi:hypothetical protein
LNRRNIFQQPPFLASTPSNNSGKAIASLLGNPVLLTDITMVAIIGKKCFGYTYVNEDHVDAWITAQPNAKGYLCPEKTHELAQYESLSADFPSSVKSTLRTLQSKSDGELFPDGTFNCKLGHQPEPQTWSSTGSSVNGT